MHDVHIVGWGVVPFGKHVERTHKDLARAAITAALQDAGVKGTEVQSIAFASCALHAFGQGSVRGPVVLGPMMNDGTLASLPTTDVEAACASGMVAFETACRDIMSGRVETALAVGVDKTFVPDMTQLGALFAGAFDALDPHTAVYTEAARALGTTFAPSPTRLLTLDVCALLALHAMRSTGLTLTDLATVAARAKGLTVEQVLADKPILAPFTRAMCTGIADGAAAVILSSRRPASGPAVRVRSLTRVRGHRVTFEAPSVTERAAASLWGSVEAPQIDVAEVHDATAYSLIAARRALRLSDQVVLNPSGGLLKRGHALAATGLSMVASVTHALRTTGATRGLVHNAGGFAGLDEAVCALAVLERVS